MWKIWYFFIEIGYNRILKVWLCCELERSVSQPHPNIIWTFKKKLLLVTLTTEHEDLHQGYLPYSLHHHSARFINSWFLPDIWHIARFFCGPLPLTLSDQVEWAHFRSSLLNEVIWWNFLLSYVCSMEQLLPHSLEISIFLAFCKATKM